SVAAGFYATPQSVVVTESLPTTTIHYTLNTNVPTEDDPTVVSGSAVMINQSAVLFARAWRAGWVPSDGGNAQYVMYVAPIDMSPGGGSYTSSQTVTLTTLTPGAQIHYTTTGIEPTDADPTVTSGGTVTVGVSGTLKAKGFRAGWSPGATAASTYALTL